MAFKNVFIKVAIDCPVNRSEAPKKEKDQEPVHFVQYELLMKHPYKFNHEELVFEVYSKQNKLPDSLSDEDAERIRNFLFSRQTPDLRASALTRQFGFGAHYDEEGKIALFALESEEYPKLVAKPSLKKIPAFKIKSTQKTIHETA